MHPVHNAPVRIENYWIAKFDFLDEPAVLYDVSNRRRATGVEPIGAVELADLGERHVLDRHLINGRNEPVYIPCIEPAATRPKVILLPHVHSVAPRDRLAVNRHLFAGIWPGFTARLRDG